MKELIFGGFSTGIATLSDGRITRRWAVGSLSAFVSHGLQNPRSVLLGAVLNDEQPQYQRRTAMRGMEQKRAVVNDKVGSIVDLYVSDLKALFDELKLNKPVLVGFASGGHGTMVFAARYPTAIGKLVLLNSSPYFLADSDWAGFSVEQLKTFSRGIDQAETYYDVSELLLVPAIPEQCGQDLERLKEWY